MINIGGFTGLSNSIKIGGGISSFNPFRMIDNGILVNATFERSGDIIRDGETFLEDEAVSQGGRYWHNGRFTNEFPIVDFFTDAGTNLNCTPTVDTVTINGQEVVVFDVPTNGIAETVPDNFGDLATACYYIWSETSGVIKIRRADNDSQNSATVNLSPGLNEYAVQSGPFSSRPRTLTIDNRNQAVPLKLACVAQLTKTPYSIAPIYIPTSGAPASIDTAASAPNPDKHGANWENTDPRNDWLFTLLSGPSGTLSIDGLNITPDKTQWQTVGDLNKISGAAGNQIIYIEIATGLACATDGTNVCKSLTEYTAGADHNIDLVFNGSQMAIVLDGVQGVASAYVGTFSPGATVKAGLGNEDLWAYANIYGQPGTPVIL